MSFDEFVDHNSTRAHKITGNRELLKKINSTKTFAPKLQSTYCLSVDRIFGGNTIDIRPQGSAELSFAVNISKNQNPTLPEKAAYSYHVWLQRKNSDERDCQYRRQRWNWLPITILKRHSISKIKWSWSIPNFWDDIIKRLKPVTDFSPLNSQLIQGSKSLFGIKTQLQFGRMTVTKSIFSLNKRKSQTIDVQGGAQTTTFWYQGGSVRRQPSLLPFLNISKTSTMPTSATWTELVPASTLHELKSGLQKGFISSQNNQNRNIVAFRRSRWSNAGHQPDALIPYPNPNPEPSGFRQQTSLTNIIPGITAWYFYCYFYSEWFRCKTISPADGTTKQ